MKFRTGQEKKWDNLGGARAAEYQEHGIRYNDGLLGEESADFMDRAIYPCARGHGSSTVMLRRKRSCLVWRTLALVGEVFGGGRQGRSSECPWELIRRAR